MYQSALKLIKSSSQEWHTPNQQLRNAHVFLSLLFFSSSMAKTILVSSRCRCIIHGEREQRTLFFHISLVPVGKSMAITLFSFHYSLYRFTIFCSNFSEYHSLTVCRAPVASLIFLITQVFYEMPVVKRKVVE